MLKLRKWGNSLGIIIPKNIRKQLGLKDGDTLSINVRGKEIVLERIKKDTVLLDCIDCGATMKHTCIINGYYQYNCPDCNSEVRSNKIRHIT